MTLAELVQLYAPLAGLILMSFWVGSLSQRVRGLETVVKRFVDDEGPGGSWERLVRLEGRMETANEQLASIKRGMAGVQRQLATLAMRSGALPEFGNEVNR